MIALYWAYSLRRMWRTMMLHPTKEARLMTREVRARRDRNDLFVCWAILAGTVSVDLQNGVVTNNDGKALGWKTRRGYRRIELKVDGQRYIFRAHRVVCIYAHGMPPPDLSEVNHINGDKDDNRPDNLEWSDRGQNIRHAQAMGISYTKRGVASHYAKLTEADVYEIRRLRADGVSAKDVAERFVVGVGQVYAIAQRRAWAHLPDDHPAHANENSPG